MKMKSHMTSLACALGVIFFLSIFSGDVRAQRSRGGVSGVVKDSSGATVGGADVSLVNAHQAVFGTTRTDAEGRFQFKDVPPGSYVVVAFQQKCSRWHNLPDARGHHVRDLDERGGQVERARGA